MRAAIELLRQDCVVVGSKPTVPVRGIEQALGQPVYWIDATKPVSWSELGLEPPEIFFQSGWSYPAFAALGREVKGRGGAVIGFSDANWRGDFRQLVLGPIAFRTLYRHQFDALMVPGRQGRRLVRFFGMPADRISMGMYGADRNLFNGGMPLSERPKTFLYVGQFIARKNVLPLARAFQQFCLYRTDWTLQLVGSGVERVNIPMDPRIIVEDFIQPEQLVDRYRTARFLVLPSIVEAWGLVVHEAALCGCGLILSNAIGSADDLATEVNSIKFRAKDEKDLLRALLRAANSDVAWLTRARSSFP